MGLIGSLMVSDYGNEINMAKKGVDAFDGHIEIFFCFTKYKLPALNTDSYLRILFVRSFVRGPTGSL